jgi:hypothetical protein
MGTIGVSRKPQARGGYPGGRRDGSCGRDHAQERERPEFYVMGRLNSRCTDDLLVNCGQPPHILTMTPKIKIEADTGHQDVALTRWEDEGGSSIPSPTSRARKYGKRQVPTNSVGEPVTEVTPHCSERASASSLVQGRGKDRPRLMSEGPRLAARRVFSNGGSQ